jgi:dimethylargininase
MIAFTRGVSASIARCELTHLPHQPIDVERARAQHAAYERTLADLGCRVVRLPEAPDLPDAVFVEDAAVVLDELAVIARPGAASRRAETAAVAAALRAHRPLRVIEPPGTLDGGDVLALGRTLFAGRSGRSNAEGIEQLRRHVAPCGYAVETVETHGCLHLKSAVTAVAPGTLLVQPAWADPGALPGWDVIEVDRAEPFAANALLVREVVLHPAAFPCTRARLEARGIRVRAVDVSELAKAEGGVTCCSLLVGG